MLHSHKKYTKPIIFVCLTVSVLAFLNSKWSSYSNEQKLRNYILSKISYRNLEQELDANQDTYILMPQLPACEAKSSVLVNF